MARRPSNNALLLQLVEDVGGLKSSVEFVKTAQTRADGKRADLYREIGNCRRDIAEVKQAQALTARSVTQMEPIVASLDQRHQRRIGAGVSRKQVWWVASGLVTITGVAGAKLTPLGEWLTRNWPFK